MGQLSRQIKEKFRQVRCRFRSQPVLSAEIQSKGQKALLELRKNSRYLNRKTRLFGCIGTRVSIVHLKLFA